MAGSLSANVEAAARAGFVCWALPSSPNSIAPLTMPPSPRAMSSQSSSLYPSLPGHAGAIICHILIPVGREQEIKLIKMTML